MALRACSYPVCNGVAAPGMGGYCVNHQNYVRKPKREKEPHHALYDTRAWRKERRIYLNQNPWCVDCKTRGIMRPASHVHHIIEHQGDEILFWDIENNWRGLCNRCHTATHNTKKSK
jgi:5-methylcytosine-specific restriction protein A